MVWKSLAALVAAVVLVIAINVIGNLVFNAGAPQETPVALQDRRGEAQPENPSIRAADVGEAEQEPAQEVIVETETRAPVQPTEESEQFQAEAQEAARPDDAEAPAEAETPADAPAEAEVPAEAAPEPDPAAAPGELVGDPEAGQAAIRVCIACHTFDQGGPNRVGPNMWGVFGADVASKDGFNYSPAMQNHPGVWDAEQLDAYLADPRGYIPGNRMAFAGVRDDATRSNIIAYLQTLQ